MCRHGAQWKCPSQPVILKEIYQSLCVKTNNQMTSRTRHILNLLALSVPGQRSLSDIKSLPLRLILLIGDTAADHMASFSSQVGSVNPCGHRSEKQRISAAME
jgi:hypothetical protein